MKSTTRFLQLTSILFFFTLTLMTRTSFADAPSSKGPEGKTFGAGLYLGEPTGITAKGYLTSRVAVGGIASWSFSDEAFTLIGDVTYDFLDLPLKSSAVSIPFYAGAGAKIGIRSKHDDKTVVGVRIPVGVAFQWNNYPIEVSVEAAPGVEFAPDTDFDIMGGIGVRYYFF